MLLIKKLGYERCKLLTYPLSSYHLKERLLKLGQILASGGSLANFHLEQFKGLGQSIRTKNIRFE